jgi:dienelactone hydrolase
LIAGLVLVIDGLGGSLSGRRGPVKAVTVALAALAVALMCLTFVPAVMATNAPRPELGDNDPSTYGVSYRSVSLETADGVSIAGWYIGSRNGAAVVVRHGAGSTRTDVLPQAIAIARAGYGVLLTDARGHGESGGRAMDFGWYGDADIAAAVTFVERQPDVRPARIGIVGMSMGGEEAIGAAASDRRIRAVVAEGVTARSDADVGWLSDAYGLRGRAQEAIEWMRFTLTDVLTSASKPVSLESAITTTPSTPFLVIAGGEVRDEAHVLAHLAASDPANLETWTVPDAGHTDGVRVAPEQWQHTVTAFLERHLGDAGE